MILIGSRSGIIVFTRIQKIAFTFGFVAMLILGMLPALAQKPTPKPKPVYLRRDRTTLILGKSPFRNIGVNLPLLFTNCLANHDKENEPSLIRAKNAGVRFVRCSVILGTKQSIQLLKSQPEAWFAAFDRMLALADAQGIAIVPTLFPRYSTLFSLVMSPAPSDSSPNAITHRISEVNTQALSLIRSTVSRFRDDPRILFWEIGDRWNLDAEETSEFTHDMIQELLQQTAQQIKQIDRKHLVSTGNAEMAPNAFHKRDKKPGYDSFREYTAMIAALTPEPCDFASVQQFPPGDDTPQWLVRSDDTALVLPWTRNAADEINRPLFVASFASQNPKFPPVTSQKWLADFLKRLEAGVAPLACLAYEDFLNPDTDRLLADANAAILIEVTTDAKNRR